MNASESRRKSREFGRPGLEWGVGKPGCDRALGRGGACFSQGSSRHANTGRAFTLLELLVVLAIIGVLAAMTMPALKGMRKASVMDSALRQLMDDLALARQVAINERTTVHVVFVPPEIELMTWRLNPPLTRQDQAIIRRVRGAPYRGYALYAKRSLGDQPGRHHDRYITPWRTLPEGIIFAMGEFATGFNINDDPVTRPLERLVLPFPMVDIWPTISGANAALPHIAFNQHGRLVYGPNELPDPRFLSEYIDLKEGSILSRRDANDNIISYDVMETESPLSGAYNRIEIDAFTGRARVDQPRIL